MVDPARRIDPELPNLPAEVVDEYRSAPPSMSAEVIDGALHPQARPRPAHARSSGRLLQGLGSFDDEGPRGGWVLLLEPELRLGPLPDILQSDLVGWRRSRMPRLPDDPFISLPPDFVCEVLSPSTEAVDRGKKMRVFRREGVGHVWLVSPELQTLEVYRLEHGRYSLLDAHSADAVVRAEPFELVELALARLWAR
jgi:Uma2 family endonuclease